MIVDHAGAMGQDEKQTKKRILIVDDDEAVRAALRKVLDDAGYEVILAGDGDEGERQFVSHAPELVLLDLELPKQDGWDVLGLISSQAPLVPVIIITGLRSQLDTTIIPGISGLFEKPVEVPILLRTIRDLLAESTEVRLSRLRRYLEPRQRNPTHCWVA
jgi:DNA-binding response OmpR family regulator